MTTTLLIVEDDLELQELYTHMLDGTGWEIEQVGDGQQALERLKESTPDVLILDIILDEMNGDEVYREVRCQSGLKDIPVVVVSVLSAERCRMLIQVDEATVFLRKPFHRHELLDTVREMLKGRDR